MFEPVDWTSVGVMTLADGAKEYTYYGVTRDVYDTVKHMCRQGRRGEVYKLLGVFSRKDDKELSNICKNATYSCTESA